MAYTFTLSEVIPATPEAIYDAWLDSRGHSAMTRSKATASADVGGAFTAWDGYISGRNVQLVQNARIVQTWRTTAFTPEQQYSTVTVLLTPVPGGTRVTLTHANVPDDHKGYENGGWQDYYFTPMKAYFGKPAAAEPKAAKGKATPKKAAPKKAASKKAAARKAAAKKAAAKKARPKAAKAKMARRKMAKAKRAKAATRKAGARKAAARRPAKRPARSKKRK